MEAAESTVLYRAIPAALRFSLSDKRALKRFGCDLSRHILENRPFTCLITSDQAVRRLNSQWRGKDKPTDVLSFPSESPALSTHLPGHIWFAGDLAVSIDRAADQANTFNHSVIQEIQVLMLHGVLHLAGMDHEQDRGEMAKAEAHWRTKLNLPDGLITRARPRAVAAGLLARAGS